ncbi:hypothetical protein ONZ45_g3949 [Pleurotus djamor]|nr:hypothetical protein ONZ45_g3949 [Pleurotus djamor]
MGCFFSKTEMMHSQACPSPSPLRQILNLMHENVAILEATCLRQGLAIPDLDAPFHPTTEAFRSDSTAAEAANIISAAALQMATILLPPSVTLYQAVGGHFKSAAIRACIESNVTEILREAGPKGMNVSAIASINGQDPQKLGRFLRILATNHIYREVSPDVFTNNRISSMLDTLKPTQDLFACPEEKHIGTPGLAALASHHLDEAFKASAYSWETLSDPVTRSSGDPSCSPFAHAIGSPETLWTFYERPEELYRQKRFDIGMQGIQALQPPDAVLGACDWQTLPDGALVVDVGGGVGTSALSLNSNFPSFNIVVQDLPAAINGAKNVWAAKRPEAIQTGRVRLEIHDFFSPQTRTGPAVFLLKQILHDWSDEYCVKILSHLRNAAIPQTKLVIMDSIMPFACHDPSADDKDSLQGVSTKEAPYPLLANYGAVNNMGYYADIDMFLLFNSQERTITHMRRLLKSTGWNMVKVHRQPGGDSTFLQGIEAVPDFDGHHL